MPTGVHDRRQEPKEAQEMKSLNPMVFSLHGIAAHYEFDVLRLPRIESTPIRQGNAKEQLCALK